MFLLGASVWSIASHILAYKGRTIRKVMGGGGGENTKKKFVQAKMPEKKILASRDGRKKNSCRRRLRNYYRKYLLGF